LPVTKLTPYVALAIIVGIGVSYFLFLAATWQQFQKDRMNRDTKIDELLDRIPKPVPDTE
jgi:hypothetical protein